MTYRVNVSFPYFTGLPEDVVVNTWHFQWLIGSPAEGDFSDLRTRLGTFYNAIYSNTAGVGNAPWLRPLINTMSVYNLDDPEPRPPVHESTISLTLGTPLTSSTVTPETALCLSYQADTLAGVPQARRRGRIFLGGLQNPITAGTASSFPGVASTHRTIVANAAAAFLASSTGDDWIWVVHSRTVAGDAPVTNGWIDDEPDTQRRRGRAPTVRTLWT